MLLLLPLFCPRDWTIRETAPRARRRPPASGCPSRHLSPPSVNPKATIWRDNTLQYFAASEQRQSRASRQASKGRGSDPSSATSRSVIPESSVTARCQRSGRRTRVGPTDLAGNSVSFFPRCSASQHSARRQNQQRLCVRRTNLAVGGREAVPGLSSSSSLLALPPALPQPTPLISFGLPPRARGPARISTCVTTVLDHGFLSPNPAPLRAQDQRQWQWQWQRQRQQRQ